VEIQEKIDQRTLQSRTGCAIDHKSAAADFCSGLEVENPQRLAQRHMVFRRKVEGRLVSPNTHFGVILSAGADRAGLVRQVGDLKEQIALLFIRFIRILPDLVDPLADAPDFRLDRAGVLTLFLGHPDFLADPIPVTLELLPLSLSVSALFIDLENGIHLGRQRSSTVLEAFFDLTGVLSQQSDV
jgi:hypothetical protein